MVSPRAPLGVPLDKWLHASGYAVLAVLLAWARTARTWQALLGVVVLAAGYGAGLELVQVVIPSRTPSAGDLLADAVGALLGAGAWRKRVR